MTTVTFSFALNFPATIIILPNFLSTCVASTFSTIVRSKVERVVHSKMWILRANQVNNLIGTRLTSLGWMCAGALGDRADPISLME